MKLKTLIEANEPLKRLTDKRFASYKKMRELVRLRKALELEIDFYATEEQKAVTVYAETDDKSVKKEKRALKKKKDMV